MTIHFRAEDWARIKKDYTAWWRGELSRPLLYISGVAEGGNASDLPAFPAFLTNFPLDVTPVEVVHKFVETLARQRYVADTFPYFLINFGPGVLSAFLGAKLLTRPDTVWFKPADGVSLSNLRIEFDESAYWWQRVKSITETSVEMIGHIVQITFTDMGGNLDILAGLVGTEPLLRGLLDHPNDVHRALERITEVWLECYDELYAIIRRRCPGTQAWAPTWAPASTYMLQSDFSFMISPDMFKEFVLPDLESCCDHVEYSFYHLDGVGEIPHLEHLLSLDKLRGIQWIPGAAKPIASEWPDLLRRIRDGGKLAQIYTDCSGVRKICREIGGKGFLFVVGDAMPLEEAEAFVEEIHQLSG